MDIEISKSVTNAYVYRHLGWRCFIIGTHNKFFHSDDVVACAMLCLLHEKRKIEIVRTRDEQILQECNICVDIGGGAFDHHMPDFNKVRENKIPYASAGLVWKRFAIQIWN